MKVRTLIRMSTEYQVAETEAMIDVEDKSDIQETIAAMEEDLVPAVKQALKNTLVAKDQVDKERAIALTQQKDQGIFDD